MTNRWTLSPRRSVIQTIYSFRHEEAVALRDAIWTLAEGPIPDQARAINTLEHGYEIQIEQYLITYQLVWETNTIKILLVEVV